MNEGCTELLFSIQQYYHITANDSKDSLSDWKLQRMFLKWNAELDMVTGCFVVAIISSCPWFEWLRDLMAFCLLCANVPAISLVVEAQYRNNNNCLILHNVAKKFFFCHLFMFTIRAKSFLFLEARNSIQNRLVKTKQKSSKFFTVKMLHTYFRLRNLIWFRKA